MSDITVGVTGLNAVDSPGPGVPVLRSLKESGLDLRLVGLAYDVLDPGNFMQELLDASYIIPYPSSGEQALLERLEMIQQKEKFNVLLPTLDSELENFIAIKDRLVEMKVDTFLPQPASLRMRDKTLLEEHLGASLVKLPETYVLQDVSALRELAGQLDFPLYMKGRFYDAYLAQSIDEAVGYFYRIASSWGLPILAQQSIKGEECNVAALSAGGKMLGAVAMKKLYLTDKGKGWAGVTIKNEQILELSAKILNHLNWDGGCELEFIIEEKTREIYLLEMNPRFPAWVYLATRAGINLPAMCLQLAIDSNSGAGLRPAQQAKTDYEVGTVFVRHSWDEIVPMQTIDSLSTSGQVQYR